MAPHEELRNQRPVVQELEEIRAISHAPGQEQQQQQQQQHEECWACRHAGPKWLRTNAYIHT
eukprot:5824734-Heterocapsa_arctica.AAC.1